MTDQPYTPADVSAVALAVARTLGVDPFADSDEVARAALNALAAAGRLMHDCERACPFESLWAASDPKPDEALAKLQAAFNDTVSDLSEARTTADEMTRAVKRLVGERDRAIAESAELAAVVETLRTELTDARAEADGARSDYEQLKGFNAELAAERDRLQRELDQLWQGDKLLRVLNVRGGHVATFRRLLRIGPYSVIVLRYQPGHVDEPDLKERIP